MHYDLDAEKEVLCLNNYEGIFDIPQQFVLTPFFIPVRELKNGKFKPTNKYFEISHNQTFVVSQEKHLRGRIYNMHDEMSLHNLVHISEASREGKKVKKIDLALSQSVFMGESIFHLCFDQFKILERFHKQLCGTIVPGESSDVHHAHGSKSHAFEDVIARAHESDNAFEQPLFRRVVQLLIRKNQDGDSPLNLAIRNRNFRCFELMLSILLNAGDVFVSRNFLNDLGFMIEIEAQTVELFFDKKFVDNFASREIEKVRWTIEAERVEIVHSSQLFSIDLIEQFTAPKDKNHDIAEESKGKSSEDEMKKVIGKRKLGIHSQLVEQQLKDVTNTKDASMKAVDVKLLDLDWIFENGNGNRFVGMLS